MKIHGFLQYSSKMHKALKIQAQKGSFNKIIAGTRRKFSGFPQKNLREPAEIFSEIRINFCGLYSCICGWLIAIFVL